MTEIEKLTNKLICEYIHEDFLEFQKAWNEDSDYLVERSEKGKMTVQLLADELDMDWQIVQNIITGRKNASPSFLTKYCEYIGKGKSWIGHIYKKAEEEARKKVEGAKNG